MCAIGAQLAIQLVAEQGMGGDRIVTASAWFPACLLFR